VLAEAEPVIWQPPSPIEMALSHIPREVVFADAD